MIHFQGVTELVAQNDRLLLSDCFSRCCEDNVLFVCLFYHGVMDGLFYQGPKLFTLLLEVLDY